MNYKNRLCFELMAREGMKVGKGLKLQRRDIEDWKPVIQHPKSGKETEVVFLPQKVAGGLKRYIREYENQP